MTTIPLRLLFLGCVLAEVAVLILIGSAIGIGWTLLLVLLAVVAGFMLLRRQGMAMLARLRGEVAAGRSPGPALIEGTATALAAVLLIVPGFVSDIVAIALLTPPLRKALFGLVAYRLKGGRPQRTQSHSRPQTIELDAGDFAARSRRPGALPRRPGPRRPEGEV